MNISASSILLSINWLSFLIETKSVPKTALSVKKGFTNCQNLLFLFKLLSVIFLKWSFLPFLQSLLHLFFCFLQLVKFSLESQSWYLFLKYRSIHYCLSWSRTVRFKKIFAKLKFSPPLFERIPSFFCLVLKIGNKWILKLQNLFS